MSVQRKGKEPSEVLVRKFNRIIQTSGIFTEVKKRKYHEKEPSRQITRLAAIRKANRKSVKRGY